MRNAICKLFSFLLDLVKQVVTFVADTLIAVGTAAVEVLSDVLGAASSAFFSSPFGVIILGVGCLFIAAKLGLFSEEDDEKKEEARAKNKLANRLDGASPVSEGLYL